MRNALLRNRWVFSVVMFLFLIFHQTAGFLIEPITEQFWARSNFGDRWFGTKMAVDVIVSMLFFLVWGYFFDSHSRKKLLSLAGFVWGVTFWLMGIAPTFATFNVSKAASGLARASYSGIFAMVGDLFKPNDRGKILGLLLLAQPLAYVFGLTLPDVLLKAINWRVVMLIFGAIGLIISLAIHFFINEPARGAQEPALKDIHMVGTYQFEWETAKATLAKSSLIMIYAVALFGIIPWIVLPDGLLIYLMDIQALQTPDIYLNLAPTLIGITLGYPMGGLLGDLLIRSWKNGRMYACLLGLVIPSICLYTAFQSSDVTGSRFLLCLVMMGFFMAFTWSNLIASVLDISLPELRATTIAIILLVQAVGTLISPLVFSMVIKQVELDVSILWICLGAWVISMVLVVGVLFFNPKDVEQLRRHMAYRSHLEAHLDRLKSR